LKRFSQSRAVASVMPRVRAVAGAVYLVGQRP
jgi:hypothetical protein